jgi:hypothetical protein
MSRPVGIKGACDVQGNLRDDGKGFSRNRHELCLQGNYSPI